MKLITHKGCNAVIPNRLAIAPVMNGNTADPVCPSPAIQPIEPVSNHGGSSAADCFMKIGYIGPKNRPTIETATAFPMREGMNQMVNSRLVGKRDECVILNE